jgi:transcriptional regulator GlxA family with amidase domain
MIINVDLPAGTSKTNPVKDRARWAPFGSDRIGEANGRTTGGLATEVIHNIGHSIEFMRAHLHEPLQVSTLAAVASVSSSHFFAMFKRLTGRAPIEFFISLRMQRACELLDETSLSVKEVAAILGYDDQFYFSRVFKLATGVPPTQYRALADAARFAIKDNLTPAAPFMATND